MVVFGQRRLYLGKMFVFGQIVSTWSNLFLFGQSWLCLSKGGCTSAKVVVFVQNGCI